MNQKIEIIKINDFKIKPLKLIDDNKKIKHDELFKDAYPNVFISSQKNSGKSTLIYNIVKEIALINKTKIYIFSTTYNNDNTTIEALRKYDKYKINYEIHDDLNDLDDVFNNIDSNLDLVIGKYNKSKYRYPLYILIFDDMPKDQLRNNKTLETIIKRNRHFKIFNLISSQNIYDLSPTVRSNLDYLILFSGLSIKNLKTVYEEQIKKLTFDQFLEIYNLATEKQFNFIYINCKKLEFRINFDQKINI